MDIKKHVLIVAGGSGRRMHSATPKQFVKINGKPLLMHTFDAFTRFDPTCEFVLVLPSSEIIYWKELCNKMSFHLNHKVVIGGNTRFHSVKKGLEQIDGDGIVFIHDGVRPLVSLQTIENCYQAALKYGNAIPVIAPSESIREVLNEQSRAVDRNRYFLVQTPQTFQTGLIKKAYKQEFKHQFTDDASVLEKEGSKIILVEGNRENLKVTYPEDLKIASSLLKND